MPTRPDSAAVVIFGAGGDLMWRKLTPALYNLSLDGRLPERMSVLGLDKKEHGLDEFRANLREGIDRFSRRGRGDAEAWGRFAPRFTDYLAADFADPKTFGHLSERLAALDTEWNARANRIFYLAVPPSLVKTIVEGPGRAGLARDRKRTRIVVEKPFGRDLASARALDRMLAGVFDESQIFRIDHYLGKETVQNILAFRFANALFEPIWDRRPARGDPRAEGHDAVPFPEAGARERGCPGMRRPPVNRSFPGSPGGSREPPPGGASRSRRPPGPSRCSCSRAPASPR